ncbi:uncharacterized protein NECHADRAFT_88157 [Fusarium vanettenii 77-13-4]|uniref:Uncharacterized protein n=1 Tax=Fusarium vanettenii (strain ATCC MYA-4622 / CBS 123669 / FGSC 9596 / NRRL 45880 / 77-13-4) TaxID=660122 RepID=C7ZDW7_FUSV7|nr:uncharacterized protein NECHADRAFT_88157 [Fusarium vanettenii 77-13-4]EEU37762.1 hypothetical protein NECHADRAFT_88157 [Fusarium vanettenii 77-13-4]
MFQSLRASRRLSDPSNGSQGIPINDSALQLQGSRDQDFTHQDLSNTTSLAGWNDTADDTLILTTQGRSFTGYDGSSSATTSINSLPEEKWMLRPKFGPAAVAMLLLALLSTTLSGLWLAVAIIQPRWGFMISTTHGLSPSNAATLTALLGKTIEIASITVFISCIGQVLSRRAVAEESAGITLADITIRNWVIQPGFIFTHHQTLLVAGRTLLGALALLALVATILYTTASEALVSPKLKYGKWETRELTAAVHSYYGNFAEAGARCMQEPDLIQNTTKKEESFPIGLGSICLGHELKYKSTRDFLAFTRHYGAFGSAEGTKLLGNGTRPVGYTLLHDNVTLEATRVDTEYSDVAASYERWGRIIDNVTVSIPHPSVWSASRFPRNKILQPEDLSNAGGFSIRAAVVSPTLNTLCVNIDKEELAPLVYTEFPYSEKDFSEEEYSESSFEIWAEEEMSKWDNSTIVDDVFRWGSKYGRRRPVFEFLPNEFHIVYHRTSRLNDTIYDAGYLLAHLNEPGAEYTLCQMRSWLSTDCSTWLEVSGVGQPIMRAHCEDGGDEYRHDPSAYKSSDNIVLPELWPWILGMWESSIALEHTSTNGILGFQFIMTAGILTEPDIWPYTATMSEILSVLLLSTLTLASVDTQLRHTWDHGLGKDSYIVDGTTATYGFNTTETFRAGIRSQEYTSGHTESWQRLFYLVLGPAFALNLLCLAYLVRWSGLINDITEPQNHFSLAMSSSPSSRMERSYPDGPKKQHWEMSWRVCQDLADGGCRFGDCDKDL